MNQSFEGFQWFDARKSASLVMAPQAFFAKKMKLLDTFDPIFPETWPLKHPTDSARALKELYSKQAIDDENRRNKCISISESVNAEIEKDRQDDA
jgi:hypothetical protein